MASKIGKMLDKKTKKKLVIQSEASESLEDDDQNIGEEEGDVMASPSEEEVRQFENTKVGFFPFFLWYPLWSYWWWPRGRRRFGDMHTNFITITPEKFEQHKKNHSERSAILSKMIDPQGNKKLVIVGEKENERYAFLRDANTGKALCSHVVEAPFLIQWLKSPNRPKNSLCPICNQGIVMETVE